MCRFLGYLGAPVLLDHLLYGPDNSLVKQTYDPAMLHQLNLAGLGVLAWDGASHDPERPFAYKTTGLPVFDPNLKALATKVHADAVLAHVRGVAYGPHAAVGPENLHPFLFEGQRVALAHNGDLARFLDMRFDLAARVAPRLLGHIRGSTDSEWIYAIVASELQESGGEGAGGAGAIAAAVVRALRAVREVRRARKVDVSSSVNLLLSDGQAVVATRFTFDFGRYEDRVEETTLSLLSLWYTLGESYAHDGVEWKMSGRAPRSLLVASEPLTKDTSTWIEVPEDTMLIAERDGDRIAVRTAPIDA
jgi:glutamine amidotransferase